MLEQKIGRYYQQIFVAPMIACIRNQISPLTITFLSGMAGILFVPFLLLNMPWIALAFLLLSGYLDTVDGSLARAQDKTSDFGSVMDIVMDRLVEFAVLFGFYLMSPAHHALAVILMLGSILLCITSFLVVGIFTSNQSHKSFHYSPGLMERAEAFGFFIVMTLCPGYFNLLAALFCVLVCLTALIRLIEFKQQQDKK